MTILVYVLWYVFAGFPLWKILEMELLLDDVLLCESTALLVMQTFLPSYCLKTVLLRVFLILKLSPGSPGTSTLPNLLVDSESSP